MAEEAKHINYSFEDIQRYLQGKMPAREMHELEKAALQDAFLADAIEGYREADRNLAQQHLNEINTALLRENRKSKVVELNRKNQWLSVVAMVTLLAGIGMFAIYLFKNSARQPQVAQVKENNVQDKDSSNSPLQTLSAPNAMSDTAATITQENNQQQIASLKTKRKRNIAAKNKNLPEQSSATTMAFSPAIKQKQDTVAAASAEVFSQLKKDDSASDVTYNPQRAYKRISGIEIAPNVFAGKVTDANGNPVPFATIESTDKRKTSFTDAEGNFSLPEEDSTLVVNARVVGYEPKTIRLQPGSNNSIVLDRSSIALNEVVVTALGNRKAKPIDEGAMPVGGWSNFNNYVVGQLNKDSGFNNTDTHDFVIIEFLIDKKGNPYNFKMVKSLNDEKDSTAIDILKSGPKWISASKDKKIRVSIAMP